MYFIDFLVLFWFTDFFLENPSNFTLNQSQLGKNCSAGDFNFSLFQFVLVTYENTTIVHRATFFFFWCVKFRKGVYRQSVLSIVIRPVAFVIIQLIRFLLGTDNNMTQQTPPTINCPICPSKTRGLEDIFATQLVMIVLLSSHLCNFL